MRGLVIPGNPGERIGAVAPAVSALSQEHTLREIPHRQQGEISLHGPPRVQQRLRIGAVGNPVEVALILHPVEQMHLHPPRIRSSSSRYTGPGLPRIS